MISAKDYFKAKDRMTHSCEINCLDCKLYADNNGKNVSCYNLEPKHTEYAVKIVEEWVEQHPVKTNLQVFKEEIKSFIRSKYGNKELYCSIGNEIPMLYCDNFSTCEDCEKFWNSEYKESVDDKND